jgi:single-stranded DNA-binding protein
MTFSTATIQGYVTYKKSSTTPQGRAVVNMLLAVPNKRQNGTTADTYKVSVWDNQALAAAEYISAENKQIITCSGQLKLDEYSVEQGKPMMRLDFASILDYGNSSKTAAERMNQLSDKQKFVNMMDDVETTKEQIAKVKNNNISATAFKK